MTTATITAPVDPAFQARMVLAGLERDGIITIEDEPICSACFAYYTEQPHFIGCPSIPLEDNRWPGPWPGLNPWDYGFTVTRDTYWSKDGVTIGWLVYSPSDPTGWLSHHENEAEGWIDAARIASGQLLEMFGTMANVNVEWGW